MTDLNDSLPSLCAVTMVKDDYFFLKKWMDYYGSQVGACNLYVISHGGDPVVASLAAEANVIPVPVRSGESVGHPRFDADRFELINNLCNGLVRYYDYVLFVDVDEIVVVDPALALNLREYLAREREARTISAVGLDVFHKRSIEGPLDEQRPVLSQRRYCKLEPLYCKPVITKAAIRRSKGNHNSDDSILHFGSDLYLFHLKWIDYQLSLGLHFSRHMSRQGEQYTPGPAEGSQTLEFPLRKDVDARFSVFDSLPISSDGFSFEREKEVYQASWRRRRFLLQKAFWKSLFVNDGDKFSNHWRFDLTRFPYCHQIPERFWNVF